MCFFIYICSLFLFIYTLFPYLYHYIYMHIHKCVFLLQKNKYMYNKLFEIYYSLFQMQKHIYLSSIMHYTITQILQTIDFIIDVILVSHYNYITITCILQQNNQPQTITQLLQTIHKCYFPELQIKCYKNTIRQIL